ncbi:hypothetical protein N4R57_02890 [Rhodobacteraceae bacterium D3-12]|nr:hypothetical protein N4R57_02890 [Rhodobacteraceae bacterium D3-12]
MHINNPMSRPTADAFQPTAKCPSMMGRFQLSRADWIGVERLLSLGLTAECPNPTLIEGFLRHKLRLARAAPEPTPADLVTVGRHVTFMTSGRNERSGMLTLVSDMQPGRIPVTSFLGATLLGMHKMQKTPLLREDGWIDKLVVLGVQGA